MIPPGLWAAFSMKGRVLSRLSDARRTRMCLICALLHSSPTESFRTYSCKNDDKSI